MKFLFRIQMAERTTIHLLTAVATVIIASAWTVSAASQPTGPSKTVLTIHWGPEDFPGTAAVDAAIREALLSPTDPPAHYYAEYLETEEFSSETAVLAFRDYVRQKFAGRRLDVVIANSTPALRFALRFREDLFPGVPIVFVAGAVPGLTVNTVQTGVTGILSDAPFAETLELALKLHPSRRRVFVVAQAPTSEGYEERVRTALQPFAERVELIYVRERTVADLLAALKAIPPESLIMYTRYTPEEAESVVHPDEVARLMAQVSPVPIYSSADIFFGTGIVGGVIKGSRAVGTRIGEIARQILKGARPEDIPVDVVSAVPTFDSRQIQRWEIDPSLLPPGSDIQYEVPTAWELYRPYIIGAFVLVAAQLALIAALLVQRSNRMRVEAALRVSEEQTRASYDEVRNLAGRLISAREGERARIARDLHDDIGQRVASLSIGLSRVQRQIPDVTNPARQLVSELEHQTTQLSADLRHLSHELHPNVLEHLGLLEALGERCDAFSQESGIRVQLQVSEAWRDVSETFALCLYRVVQEALRNVAAHARARNVTVSLDQRDGHLKMQVTDDGCGFDPTATTRRSGLGLVSLAERVRMLGGELVVSAAPDAGTRLAVSLPVPMGESHAS